MRSIAAAFSVIVTARFGQLTFFRIDSDAPGQYITDKL